jgi:hypothetical protein
MNEAPTRLAVEAVRSWLGLEDWQNVPAWTEDLIEAIEDAIRKDRTAAQKGSAE